MTRITFRLLSVHVMPDASSSSCSFLPGDVDRFTADSVITKDGTEIGPFDVVVAATGYERTYDYLPAKVWHSPDVQVTMQVPLTDFMRFCPH